MANPTASTESARHAGEAYDTPDKIREPIAPWARAETPPIAAADTLAFPVVDEHELGLLTERGDDDDYGASTVAMGVMSEGDTTDLFDSDKTASVGAVRLEPSRRPDLPDAHPDDFEDHPFETATRSNSELTPAQRGSRVPSIPAHEQTLAMAPRSTTFTPDDLDADSEDTDAGPSSPFFRRRRSDGHGRHPGCAHQPGERYRGTFGPARRDAGL